MHDYLFTTEVVRFAFMFGVAVSMLLYERRHLTTGSIVVPGYIATFIAMPFTILATFLNVFVSYWLINKVLRRWFLLYGRTKFTLLASTSILIQTLMLKFSPVGSWLWEKDFKLLVGVGYVVPALIAHDMGRQGITKTIKSVMLSGRDRRRPDRAGAASPPARGQRPGAAAGRVRQRRRRGMDPHRRVVLGRRSLGRRSPLGPAQWRLHGRRLHRHPGRRSVADRRRACISAATYLLVKHVLMNSMILFGRRKFSSMLLVSASLSWGLLWLGSHIFGDRHPEPHGHGLAGADTADRARPARQRRPAHLAPASAVSAPRWRRRSCCR